MQECHGHCIIDLNLTYKEVKAGIRKTNKNKPLSVIIVSILVDLILIVFDLMSVLLENRGRSQ